MFTAYLYVSQSSIYNPIFVGEILVCLSLYLFYARTYLWKNRETLMGYLCVVGLEFDFLCLPDSHIKISSHLCFLLSSLSAERLG
jgi:hypothetical protein